MKKRYILLFGVFLLLIGYTFGNIIPTEVFQFNIDWNRKLSPGEVYYYTVETFIAIGTIAAVVVALFSDVFKGMLWRPKLEVRLHYPDLQEDLDSSSSSNKKACRYHHSIDIFNSGNINAELCEVHIERIQFQGIGMNQAVDILSNEKSICWMGSKQEEITYIPVQGKKTFPLFEILPPQTQSVKGSSSQTIPPHMIIGDFRIPDEYLGGTWILSFCIYSPKIKPQKFTVTIKWDGSWEHRQMEMKNKITTAINE